MSTKTNNKYWSLCCDPNFQIPVCTMYSIDNIDLFKEMSFLDIREEKEWLKLLKDKNSPQPIKDAINKYIIRKEKLSIQLEARFIA